MYGYLKALFEVGEDGKTQPLSFEELAEKINASKDIKLINLNDGGYVAKEKLDSKITELDGVKAQLATANSTIQSYTEMDIEGIKKSAAEWEQKYNDETASLQKKLADQEKAHNQELFLRDYQFTSKAAKAGIEAEFNKKDFPYEDGKFLGAKEFMETLMQDEDYKAAFVVEEEEPPQDNSAQEQNPLAKPQFSNPNPQRKQPPKKVGLAELMRKKNENPNMEVKFD